MADLNNDLDKLFQISDDVFGDLGCPNQKKTGDMPNKQPEPNSCERCGQISHNNKRNKSYPAYQAGAAAGAPQ